MPEIQFTITGNANDLVAGLQQASKHTGEIAEDFKAISTGMDMVLERAGKMTKFYQDNVELLGQMKEILTLIGSINESNQSAMNTNLQAIREMTSQVLRQGGSFADINKMLGAASAPFGGGAAGNMVQNLFATAAQQQAQSAANEGTRAANQADTSSWEEALKRSNVTRAANHAGEGAAGAQPNIAPPPTSIKDAAGREIGTVAEAVLPRPHTRAALINNFGAIGNKYGFRRGKEEYAALEAYDQGTRQIDRILGTRGFGGAVGAFAKKQMFGDRRSVQNAISEIMNRDTDPIAQEHALAAAYNGLAADGSGLEAKKGTSEYVLHQTLQKLNRNLELSERISGTKIGGTTLGGIAGGLGTAYNIYGLGTQAAAMARVATGYAQNQAQGYGTTQYGTSAGNALEAGWRSGFGLNPFYSYSSAQQAQNNGIGMGYRGSMLRSYEDAASNLQQNYGMSQNQTAQAVSTLQQVGMTPAQTAAMLASVRGTAGSAGGGYYNTAAATQAAVSAQAGAMGWGGGVTASGAAGKVAAKFAGNPATSGILAGTGLTGQDLMNTQFGISMMASKLGIKYEDMYAYRTKAMSTEKGANQYIKSYTKMIVQQLSNSIGKDLMKAKSQEDLAAMASPITLMNILMGMGINVTTPEQALAYVWNEVRQAKGKYDAKPDKPKDTPADVGRGSSYNQSWIDAKNDRAHPNIPAGDAAHAAGGGGGSGPPSPSTPPPSTSHTGTGAYQTNPFSSAGRGSGAGNGGVDGNPLHLVVSIKGNHAKSLIDVSLDHQQNSTNGTTPPAVLQSRGHR